MPNLMSHIQSALHDVVREKNNPIIFITGPSGSGKTTLAQQLAEIYSTQTVSFDWWIKDSSPARRQKIMDDFERDGSIPDPLEWYDWGSFRSFLAESKEKKRLCMEGAWNQKSGEKDLSIDISFVEGKPIIIEGVYLYEVAELADYIIALDVDIEKSTHHALKRQSSRNPENYLKVKRKWYLEYDKPYFERNISNADLVVESPVQDTLR